MTVIPARLTPTAKSRMFWGVVPNAASWGEIVGAKMANRVLATRVLIPTTSIEALINEPSSPLLRGSSVSNNVPCPSKKRVESSIIADVAADASPTASIEYKRADTHHYEKAKPEVMSIVEMREVVLNKITILVFSH